ncbi:MAG: ubiquinol-cytochrome C chaperone family protein [Alphaproteobacteria bacterium]
MLKRLFGESAARRAATGLYGAAVDQARMPVFYTDYAVPDTVDGRFEMVTLHVFLLMRRLKAGDDGAAEASQALYDVMFDDMDRTLREMGAGDLGVGRRVKTMAQAFSGRLVAYDVGLDGADEELRAALARNVFRGEEASDEALAGLARYLRAQAAALDAQPIEAVIGGRAVFDMNDTAP